MNASNSVWSTKKYSVPNSLVVLQKDFEPGLDSLKEFYGNQFQHVLHDEFIDILNKSEPIYTSKNTHVFDKELTQVVVHFAGVGVEHNTNGYSQTAMNISDFCNSVLDHINAFDSRLFGENNTVVKYIDAFERGLQDGIRKKLSQISKDPLGYCKNIAVGTMVMAGHLIKIFQEASTQLILTRHYPEIARLKLLDDAQQVAHLTQIVSKYYKDHSGLQIAQHGGALVADVALDTFLAGKIFNAFGKLSKIAMAQRGNAASFFKRMNPQNSVAVQTADGHRFLLTPEEALQVLGDEHACSSAANIVEEITKELISKSTFKDVLDSIRNLSLENSSLIKCVQKSYSENGPVVREMLKNSFSIVGRKSKPYPVKQALAELNGKMPALNLPHLFGCEINQKGNVVGFHHARQFPERIVNGSKKYFSHKVFKADYNYNGQTLTGKTFFPDEWTKQKVIEKVAEAYKNIIPGSIGTYVMQGVTEEGIILEFILGKASETGQITIHTVYPKTI